MTVIPVDEVTRIATHWVEQPWPLDRTATRRSCDALGWQQDPDGATCTPHGLNNPRVALVVGREETGLDLVTLRLTDAVAEVTTEHGLTTNDAYVQTAAALGRLWGKATTRRTPQRDHTHWDLPNGCRVRLSNIHTSVVLHIYSPSFAAVESTLATQ